MSNSKRIVDIFVIITIYTQNCQQKGIIYVTYK